MTDRQPKTTKEWEMVNELFGMLTEVFELRPTHAKFVCEQYEHLDPHMPFLDQRSEGTLDHLYKVYDFHANGNKNAFDDEDDE